VPTIVVVLQGPPPLESVPLRPIETGVKFSHVTVLVVSDVATALSVPVGAGGVGGVGGAFHFDEM
jgi:hypothetical protein